MIVPVAVDTVVLLMMGVCAAVTAVSAWHPREQVAVTTYANL